MPDARLIAFVRVARKSELPAAEETCRSLYRDWAGWVIVLVTSPYPDEDDRLGHFLDEDADRGIRLGGGIFGSWETSEAAYDSAWRTFADNADAVVFLSSGDKVRPGFAAALAAQFGPDVVAAYADYAVNGRRVFAEPCDRKRMFEVPYAPRAALISTAALRAIDGFDFRAGEAAWLDLWMRLTERGVAVHVPEALSDLTPAPPRTEAALRAAIQRTAARA